MKRGFRIPNLGGATALIVHRPHGVVAAIARQLTAIGVNAVDCWPDLPSDALAADFLFFDADLGHDAQFPWAPGAAPMPAIALIGSEAPGRIEWALNQNADAHLLKPVGNAGVYSALLIARRAFDARKRLDAEIVDLRNRVAERHTIVQAVTLLASRGLDDEQAYAQLRALAMSWQISMEDAARRVVAWSKEGTAGDRTDIA
ncbi:MAG: ANTAR domain-containing protein [Alphaproteobacteria bacterium]|jgi:two-component system, response regulator / RNA-binding antiterminator|nr:ANTAR domain-containing protein [Alphaproteobacteria bacterium]MBU0804279.1 ANTAR domain-containing protein [Alphaproteobacteria bacterium]MBU0871110.1 ANTAR domain-containing protein [Alphaproteobacteria bacterium]MBU1400865.1 ANTAR domain-containing protein [Alphaproteobacteria bacterium]MBU1592718.1 ANTAR domain-containing protein [Alphaproteobacteria bacterium]